MTRMSHQLNSREKQWETIDRKGADTRPSAIGRKEQTEGADWESHQMFQRPRHQDRKRTYKAYSSWQSHESEGDGLSDNDEREKHKSDESEEYD